MDKRILNNLGTTNVKHTVMQAYPNTCAFTQAPPTFVSHAGIPKHVRVYTGTTNFKHTVMQAHPNTCVCTGTTNFVHSFPNTCAYTGTTNFVHSYPNVCVSIALVVKKEVVVGVVYNPILDELFTATKVCVCGCACKRACVCVCFGSVKDCVVRGECSKAAVP